MINLRQIYSFHPDGTDLSIDIDINNDGILYIKQDSDWVCVPYEKVQELSKVLENIWRELD